jgi:hypothetical protein
MVQMPPRRAGLHAFEPAFSLAPAPQLAGGLPEIPAAIESSDEDELAEMAQMLETRLRAPGPQAHRRSETHQIAARPQAPRRSKSRTLILYLTVAIIGGLSVLGAITLVRITVEWFH